LRKCETCGVKTEGNWASFYGFKNEHGVLCQTCALEFYTGVMNSAKNKEIVLADRKNERDSARAEPMTTRKKAVKLDKPLKTFVPKDVSKLKFAPGPIPNKFKGGSIRQLAYQQALANPAELTASLAAVARWLVPNGYLIIVE